jgi:hypothetical protein
MNDGRAGGGGGGRRPAVKRVLARVTLPLGHGAKPSQASAWSSCSHSSLTRRTHGQATRSTPRAPHTCEAAAVPRTWSSHRRILPTRHTQSSRSHTRSLPTCYTHAQAAATRAASPRGTHTVKPQPRVARHTRSSHRRSLPTRQMHGQSASSTRTARTAKPRPPLAPHTRSSRVLHSHRTHGPPLAPHARSSTRTARTAKPRPPLVPHARPSRVLHLHTHIQAAAAHAGSPHATNGQSAFSTRTARTVLHSHRAYGPPLAPHARPSRVLHSHRTHGQAAARAS